PQRPVRDSKRAGHTRRVRSRKDVMGARGFRVLQREGHSRARVGELSTAHGVVQTPAFMPVGSQATVKGLSSDDLTGLGFEMVLCNAYHLYLRPGHQLIAELGGLHRFMGWSRSILTDSGGYQVFSLAPLCKVSDDGVTFQSHLDGSLHYLTPERVLEIQESLGADVAMTLDECLRYPAAVAELPVSAPRYLMGVGTPEDLIEGVAHGVDLFDCVMPTRHGRTGWLFTSFGRVLIKNAQYARDESPVDPACSCLVCRSYSRA